MNNLILDVSKLSNIPSATLSKIQDLEKILIAQYISESILTDQETTEIDIGLGKLLIRVSDSEIKYKFIPSKALDQQLINTVNSKTSPLIDKLENSIQEKIMRTYKEMI